MNSVWTVTETRGVDRDLLNITETREIAENYVRDRFLLYADSTNEWVVTADQPDLKVWADVVTDEFVDGEFNLVERHCSKCKQLEVLNEEKLCYYCGNFSRYVKAKETEILKLLQANEIEISNYDSIIPDTTCSGDRQRPDFLFDCKTHYVILEVDENQHSSYDSSCEITRMRNLGQQTGGLPVWFIRYNPDNYRNLHGRKRIVGESKHKRHLKLLDWLKFCMENSPKKNRDYVRAIYLYYDEWNGSGKQKSIEVIHSKNKQKKYKTGNN